MEKDIGILLDDLNNLVVKMSVSLAGMVNNSSLDSDSGLGVLGISINLPTKTSFLEDSVRQNLKISPPSPFVEESEPLIDVLDSPDKLKIVVLLPGVRKEDVGFNLNEGYVELVIKKGGQIYRKEIPCRVRPSEIIAKSSSYNNSILEIVFNKKATR